MSQQLKLLGVLAALIAVAGISLASSRAQGNACQTDAIQTGSGAVCGVKSADTLAYLGIPYAESTAGDKRWTTSVPKAAWTNVYPATAFGKECPQNGAPRPLEQSEDCLSLNVWTPAVRGGAQLPVLVFIHGGAFVIGSSGGDVLPSDPTQAIYDGAYLAQSQKMVVVTFNYRLGALGFLAGVAGLQGNYGLQDQQLALEWVRSNIAAFGGDAAQVTISGESAGASAVGVHLLSAPRSAPLFKAAIMQSNPIGLPVRNLSEAKRTGEYYQLASGCFYALRPLECLRAKPLEVLLKAQASRLIPLAVLEFGLYSLITWSPVVDGAVVTKAPLASAASGGITKPIIIGTNTNEGELFSGTAKIGRLVYRAALGKLFSTAKLNSVIAQYPAIDGDNRSQIAQIATDYFFYCPTRFMALKSTAPVYHYDYAHISKGLSIAPANPLCAGKTCHGDELPFAFNTLGSSSVVDDTDRKAAKLMTDDWGGFVRSQMPVSANWKPFTAQGEASYTIQGNPRASVGDAKRCAFWDEFGYGRDGLKP